jgi:DNA-binding CsgD family transcriptional regulator
VGAGDGGPSDSARIGGSEEGPPVLLIVLMALAAITAAGAFGGYYWWQRRMAGIPQPVAAYAGEWQLDDALRPAFVGAATDTAPAQGEPTVHTEVSDVDAVSDLGLTAREREVLSMVAQGRSNRQIGEALYITESTAGVHVSNIMSKLGAGSRTEAAAIAYRLRLVG